MTLGQLRAFAAVARLGSVDAAAHELGVGKSAVSEAIAGLRVVLADRLYVRSSEGLALTRGGQELASRAAQILALLDSAPRAVAAARGDASPLLRIAATAQVAEFALPGLSRAFVRLRGACEFHVSVEPPDVFAKLLVDHRVDITLGPPAKASYEGLDRRRFLRIQPVLVAAPWHEVARRRAVSADLRAYTWLTGSMLEADHSIARICQRWNISPRFETCDSETAALHAAAQGKGIACVPAHVAVGWTKAGKLAVLEQSQNLPIDYWSASLLPVGSRRGRIEAFVRFLLTPEATQTLISPTGMAPTERFRPPVYVTLWS